MKKYLFSFIFLLAFIFSVSAQQLAKPSTVEQNLRKHIGYLAADKLEGRRTGENGAVAAAGYVANAFANFKLQGGYQEKEGKPGFLQPFDYAPRDAKGEILPNTPKLKAYNVIGILPGNDPQLKNEVIVIGAHYDHLGHGGQGSLAPNSTEIHHGADDNASGTAALIDIARQFSNAKSNQRTIIFISFGGEEEGLLGSKFYVNNPVFPIEKTVAMINLDMVGRLKDDKLTIGGIGTANEWKGLVERINGASSANQTSINRLNEAYYRRNLCCVTVQTGNDNSLTLSGVVPKGKLADALKVAQENGGSAKIISQLTESNSYSDPKYTIAPKTPFLLQLNEDGYGPSDHSSFYGKKVPVLFFFTGTHMDYHKPSDTIEKINFSGLVQIENFVFEIAKAIDQNPRKPTYLVAKSTGTGEGRRTFNVSLGTIPSYSDSNNDGMVIDGVRDDSPGSKAGLKANDKIVKLAGKQIRNVQDYMAVLGEIKADTEYEIVIVRGRETLILKITPAARK